MIISSLPPASGIENGSVKSQEVNALDFSELSPEQLLTFAAVGGKHPEVTWRETKPGSVPVTR